MTALSIMITPVVIGLIVVAALNRLRHRATPGGPVETVIGVIVSRRASQVIAGSIFIGLALVPLLA